MDHKTMDRLSVGSCLGTMPKERSLEVDGEESRVSQHPLPNLPPQMLPEAGYVRGSLKNGLRASVFPPAK